MSSHADPSAMAAGGAPSAFMPADEPPINKPQPPRTVVHSIMVEFGDCDPAGIVWYPNFFRWIDAASRNFFLACGVPPWRELEAINGILGTPLVDTKSRFVNTATYGDKLDIHVSVIEWRSKSCVQRYRIERIEPGQGGQPGASTLIMECEEVRIFAARRRNAEGGRASGIRAVPIPADIRRLCT